MTGQAEVRVDLAARAAPGSKAWPLLSVGAVCGLGWAAGLRGLMVEVAGPSESTVTWVGTFEGILLPGVVTGMLLGLAEHLRRSGRRRGWRWLALAPLAFPAATPTVLASIFTGGGIGGGALAIPIFGMAGGFAVSGRGPRWARVSVGVVALLPMPGWVVGAALAGGSLTPGTPRGAWVAVLFISFLAVLSLACAIPHRSVVAAPAARRVDD